MKKLIVILGIIICCIFLLISIILTSIPGIDTIRAFRASMAVLALLTAMPFFIFLYILADWFDKKSLKSDSKQSR
ncbi:MAG: hypothetical protein LBP54_00195 [Campylobacteraceae bacterium]|jgi:amino acid permease|nr:hypothetical protein [Campylobacteraceae bacterium]